MCFVCFCVMKKGCGKREKKQKQTCLLSFQRQTSPEKEPVATVSCGVVSTEVMLCVGELVHKPSGTEPSVIPSANSHASTHAHTCVVEVMGLTSFSFFFQLVFFVSCEGLPPLLFCVSVRVCVFFFFLSLSSFLPSHTYTHWRWPRPQQHLMCRL